jgi:hypothetical protein
MTEAASSLDQPPTGTMALACLINDHQLVAYGLQCGADINPAGDDRSPLHIALENRMTFQHQIETGIRFTKPEFTGKVGFGPHPREPGKLILTLINPGVRQTDFLHERKKSELIVFQLLAQGARLDHIPAASRDPRAPIDDPSLWNDTVFAGDVMTAALYCAIRRNQPLPRLRPHLAFRHAVTDCQGEPMGNAMLRTSLEFMDKLRERVAFKLRHPETPVEQVVARELPAPERDYWQPQGYRGWVRKLGL